MSVTLRYVGHRVMSFITGDVGEVSPGDTFEVEEPTIDGFLRRDDVELVGETSTLKTAKTSRKVTVSTETVTDAQATDDPKMTTEEVCDVPNDH